MSGRFTLERVLSCQPPPEEIIVHIDANDPQTSKMLESQLQGTVHWVSSDIRLGPGGGRNRLLGLAAHPVWSASMTTRGQWMPIFSRAVDLMVEEFTGRDSSRV